MRWIVALALVASASGAAPARAQAHRHGGVPVRVLDDQRAGPYAVSVWATPDVGMAMLYVVYDAPSGAAFVPPTSVRVGVAPVSGRVAEVLYDAHPEPVRHGARFVAHVMFDRGEPWRVRVVTEGPAGGGEVAARVQAMPADALGPLGLALYAIPFALVAGLRGRAALARRRAADRRPMLA